MKEEQILSIEVNIVTEERIAPPTDKERRFNIYTCAQFAEESLRYTHTAISEALKSAIVRDGVIVERSYMYQSR